jgi:hypothetical protein
MNALTAQGGQIDAVERQGMLAEANAAVPRLNPAEVRDMIAKGNVPSLPQAASSSAPSTHHAGRWNSAPIPIALLTIPLFNPRGECSLYARA